MVIFPGLSAPEHAGWCFFASKRSCDLLGLIYQSRSRCRLLLLPLSDMNGSILGFIVCASVICGHVIDHAAAFFQAAASALVACTCRVVVFLHT